MSQDSDKAPVTFQDVVSCFSEEEWKLLHEWQKELFRNVMKDIQQALISLGPLIATSVFSLRAIDKEDMCIMDHQESEEGQSMSHCPSDTIATSDVVCRTTQDENHYQKGPRDTGGREIHDCLSKEFPSLSSGNVLIMEQESEACLMDHPCTVEGENRTGHSSGHECIMPIISLIIKEEGEAYPMVHQDHERRENTNIPTEVPHRIYKESSKGVESNPDPSLGDPLVTSVFSQNIKPEEGINLQQESEPEHKSTVGDRRMTSERKYVDSSMCIGKIAPFRTLSSKAKNKVLQSSEKGTNSRRHLWSESAQELGRARTSQCESGFSNPEPSALQKGMPRDESSNTRECDNILTNEKLKCQPSTQQIWRRYTFTESDKSIRQHIGHVKHKKIHTGAGSTAYQCTECGKGFRLKTTLDKHKRTHSGVRPYHCNECGKSFIQKHHLIGHQRGHSGERPYQCTKCTKSFSWKESLIRHNKTHVGLIEPEWREEQNNTSTSKSELSTFTRWDSM